MKIELKSCLICLITDKIIYFFKVIQRRMLLFFSFSVFSSFFVWETISIEFLMSVTST